MNDCFTIFSLKFLAIITIPYPVGMQMQAAPGQQFNPPPYASTTYYNSSSGNQFYHNGVQGFPPPQQNNYTSPMEAYNTDGKYLSNVYVNKHVSP